MISIMISINKTVKLDCLFYLNNLIKSSVRKIARKFKLRISYFNYNQNYSHQQ